MIVVAEWVYVCHNLIVPVGPSCVPVCVGGHHEFGKGTVTSVTIPTLEGKSVTGTSEDWMGENFPIAR